jgi:hypothetical protein
MEVVRLFLSLPVDFLIAVASLSIIAIEIDLSELSTAVDNLVCNYFNL